MATSPKDFLIYQLIYRSQILIWPAAGFVDGPLS